MGREAVNKHPEAYTAMREGWRLQRSLSVPTVIIVGMTQSGTHENEQRKARKCFRHIRLYNCINNDQGFKHNAFLSDINVIIIFPPCGVFSALLRMPSVVMVKKRSNRLHGVSVLALSKAPSERPSFLRRGTIF